MKLAKTLALGCAVASAASMAHAAATTIYITGSTAFRTATTHAVSLLLTGTITEGDDNGGTGVTTAEGANNWIMSTPTTVVKAAWNGSAAGIQAIQGVTLAFFPDGSSGNLADTSLDTTHKHVPDIAMSDVQSVTTPFDSANLQESGNSPVGIIPFYFVKNVGANAAIGNMTPQIAQNLWSVGYIPLAFFTGQNSDESTVIYATGRNADSGTRLTAFAESGVGTLGDVEQYQPQISGANGSGTLNSLVLWPSITVNGIVQDVGNGGENSGGTLQKDLSNLNPNHINLVSYLGESDTKNLLTAGGSILTYVGVSASPTAHNPFIEGQYTFWGNEHLYYLTSASSTVSTFGDNLATKISGTTVGDSGIANSAMNVSRGPDGGVVSENYSVTHF